MPTEPKKAKRKKPKPPSRYPRVADREPGTPLVRPMHERFAQEYVKDHNASRAYKAAGYTATGNTAEVQASRLVRVPQVALRVRELDAAALARIDVEQDEVLQELRYVLFSDVRDYVVKNGELSTRDGVPIVKTRAVSGFKYKRREITRDDETEVSEEYDVRLWDKNDAILKAGNRLNLFPQRQANLNVDLATLTEEQLARIASGEDPLHVLLGATGKR